MVPEIGQNLWNTLQRALDTGEPLRRTNSMFPTMPTGTVQSKTIGSTSLTNLFGSQTVRLPA